MQKARCHLVTSDKTPTACKRMVSGSISLLYSRCFSPFSHGTCSLSVSQEYLALPDGAGGFRQDFSGPVLLRILLKLYWVSCTGLSPSSVGFSKTFPLPNTSLCRSPSTPKLPKQSWFGLLPVRSPLLGKSLLFSLPPVT